MARTQTDHQRVLEEPRRRAVYDCVRGARWPITREDVAGELGISRSLAAFHLERLVEAGLVEVVATREAAKRNGGRPPKHYRVVPDVEVNVSIPPRRYQMAGEILVHAIAAADKRGQVQAAAADLAAELGERAGAAPTVTERLTELGYEPVLEDNGDIVLANCPFHALAVAERRVTCELNHAYVQGVLRACGDTGLRADLRPGEGRCCVVVTQGADA